MGKHRPLRPAGRARRVEYRGKVARRARDRALGWARRVRFADKRSAPVPFERDHRRNACRVSDGFKLAQPFRIADKQFRRSILKEIFDLIGRVSGIQRNENSAGPNRAEVDFERSDGFGNQHRDALPRLDAQTAKCVPDLCRTAEELRVRGLAPVIGNCEGMGRVRRVRSAERIVKVVFQLHTVLVAGNPR